MTITKRWTGSVGAGVVVVIAVVVVLIFATRRHSAAATAPGTAAGLAAGNLSAAPAGTADTGSTVATAVIDCTGDAPTTRPVSLNLTCGDGSVTFTHIVWTTWSADSATGTGLLGENNCTPNCAQGSVVTEPAAVVLSAPATQDGHPIYTAMTVTPVAPNPRNFDPMSEKLPQ